MFLSPKKFYIQKHLPQLLKKDSDMIGMASRL